MLKSLLTNFFNRYLLGATSVTDVYYVLNLSVNIIENILFYGLHFIGERGEQTNKKIQKKSTIYSTLESTKGKKWRERLKALGDPVSNGKVRG